MANHVSKDGSSSPFFNPVPDKPPISSSPSRSSTDPTAQVAHTLTHSAPKESDKPKPLTNKVKLAGASADQETVQKIKDSGIPKRFSGVRDDASDLNEGGAASSSTGSSSGKAGKKTGSGHSLRLELQGQAAAEKTRAIRKELSVDEVELDSYGNKHKNLIKLHRLTEALGLEGVSVPKPSGIKSEQVQKFLRNHAPEVLKEWETLQGLYQGYEGRVPFFEDPEVKSHLSSIEAGITRAFSQKNAFESLELSDEFGEWLEKMRGEGNYLMVRSTGAEDSKKSANAGGNTSISYVVPEKEQLCAALGEVIKSYFSSVSLQNRVYSGDNPFNDDIKLAVTVQELIGEKIGGEANSKAIPKSIVLFTNEPMYIGEERFRVMRISCTYGHGEAVVGNVGVSTDTILILQSDTHPDQLYLMYDNQEKKTRLAPVYNPESGKAELVKMINPEDVVRERTLDDEMISRLYQLGLIVENYYQEPTDMELVIKNNTIYPVQARPIVRVQQLPTYIDLQKIEEDKISPIEETIQMSTTVAGKTSALQITNPREILIANSLTEVQNNQLFKMGQHKLVIIAQEEPANSHPVINFSLYGVPCLCAAGKIEDVKKCVNKMDGSHQVSVCVQSSTMHLWDANKAPMDRYISEGFIVHPAKIAHSLPVTESLATDSKFELVQPKEVKDLIYKLQTATTSEVALKALEELRANSWVSELSLRREQLKAQLVETPLAKRAIKPVKKAMKLLQNSVDAAFDNLRAVLEQKEGARLERLFGVKVLDSLLFGNEQKGSVGRYSVLTMGSKLAAAEEQLSYQRRLSHPALFIHHLMYGKKCPSPDLYHDWRAFLLDLEKNLYEKGGLEGDLPKRFGNMLDRIDQLSSMPWFLTVEFPKTNGMDSIERANALLSFIPENMTPLLDEISVHHKAISMLEQHLDNFADPATFAKAFDELKKEVEAFMPTKDGTLLQNAMLASELKNLPPLVTQLTLNTVKDLIHVYDSAIKTMKSSQQFSNDEEKTEKFREMLGWYFELMQSLATDSTDESAFLMHSEWPIPEYMAEMALFAVNMSSNDPVNLRPSADFSVAGATMGSMTDFARHLPRTYEDFFTLCHQNMLATLALLSNNLLTNDVIQSDSFPPSFESDLKMMEIVNLSELVRLNVIPARANRPPIRTGVEVEENRILVHFNMPMRNHSGKLTLEYPADRSQPVLFHGKFMGQARERWATTVQFLNGLAIFLDLPLSNLEMNEQGLSFTFATSNSGELESVLKIYREIANFATSQMSSQRYQLLERLMNSFDVFINETKLDDFFQKLFMDNNIRDFAFAEQLCFQLIEKGRFVEQITRFANNALIHPNPNIRILGLNLLDKIAFRHKISEEIKAVITTALDDSDLNVRQKAFSLFNHYLSFSTNLDFDTELATKAAARALADGELNGESNVFQVYERLFNDETGYESAIIAASKALIGRVDARRRGAILLRMLFNKTFQCKTPDGVLMILFMNDNPELKKALLQIFDAPVKFDNRYDNAIKMYHEIVGASPTSSGDISNDNSAPLLDHHLDATELEQHFTRLFALDATENAIFVESCCIKLIRNGLLVDQITEGVKTALGHTDPKLRLFGLKLVDHLVTYRKDYNLAESAIIQALEDEDLSVRQKAFDIYYKQLFKNGRGEGIAELAAAKAMEDGDLKIVSKAMNVYKKLFAEGRGHETAIKTASSLLFNNDSNLRFRGTRIFKLLFKQNFGFEEAGQISRTLVMHEKRNFRSMGLSLFENLFQYHKGLSAAYEALNNALQDGNESMEETANQLLTDLTKLVDQGIGIDEAIAGANSLMLNNNSSFLPSSLYQKLSQQGQGNEAALEVANTALESEYPNVRIKGINLISELIKLNTDDTSDEIVDTDYSDNEKRSPWNDDFMANQGQLLSEDEELLSDGEGMLSSDDEEFSPHDHSSNSSYAAHNSSYAAQSFDNSSSTEFNAKSLYTEAEQMIKKGISDDDVGVRTAAFELLSNLVSKDKAYELAISAIVSAKQETDEKLKKLADKIHQKLIDKNIVNEETDL